MSTNKENTNKPWNDQQKVNLPFDVPSGYFEQLPLVVLKKIAEPTAKTRVSKLIVLRIAASAAAVFVLLWLVYPLFNQTQLQLADTVEVKEYIEAESYDSFDEFSFIDVDYTIPSTDTSGLKVDI
jgi:hypothetical protein